MKTLFLFICLIQTIIISAQFSEAKLITNTSDGVRWICSGDLDGDGFQDIVSANIFGNNISWYKNNVENTFNETIIGVLNQPTMVAINDLDNDGDMDVIASSTPDQLIVWYENLDGVGNFSNQKIISNIAFNVFFLLAVDIDVDGKIDILSGTNGSGTKWYKNLDGLGNFSNAIIIDSTIPSSRSLAMADIDNDNDIDIASSTSGNNNIFWYENLDGLGNFSNRIAIGGNGSATRHILLSDIDGDDDIDVLGVYGALNRIIWHENLDGQGDFSDEKIISENENALGIATGDFDNDNDIDILTASVNNPTLKWYENLDGQGLFSSENIIENEFPGSKCLAVDIDNDGDLDAVRSSQNDDTIVWYENLTILRVDENILDKILVHPNPTSKEISISGLRPLDIERMQISDVTGSIVWNSNKRVETINITSLKSGIYFLNIKIISGQQRIFKIIKN